MCICSIGKMVFYERGQSYEEPCKDPLWDNSISSPLLYHERKHLSHQYLQGTLSLLQ
jgi:hypothetical protein